MGSLVIHTFHIRLYRTALLAVQGLVVGLYYLWYTQLATCFDRTFGLPSVWA